MRADVQSGVMPRLNWPAGYHVSCSPDGRLLCALGRNVVVIDLLKKRRLWTAHPLSHPSDSAFSTNGSALAVKATSGQILVLNPETGVVLSDFQNENDGEGCGMAFLQDGNNIIDGSWRGALTIRHALNGRIYARDERPGEMITRITHDAARKTWLVEHQPKVRPGENIPASSYLSILKWPITSLRDAEIVNLGFDIRSATIAPDGERFCFRDRHSNRVLVARLSDGEILASTALATGGTGSELSWSADSRLIGAIGAEGFKIFRAEDLTTAADHPAEYPSSVAFHPNGQDVLLGTWKTTAVKRLEAMGE